jgi:phosphoribosylformimino-5-aminoimidazole carboxamide ribotide isomerase
MEFRPCIDVHNGAVKQIVGGTLNDLGDRAEENFVSEKDGAWFARLYRKYHLKGGHVIMLNPQSSPYYEATKAQALSALAAWPGGLQIGGGINADNASSFLEAGAGRVIVTSYVFRDGKIAWDNLKKLTDAVGPNHLVLDLSCRKRGDKYYIVTDRWQKFTDTPVTEKTLELLSAHCSEFLVHAADAEGKQAGIEEAVVKILAEMDGFPITYAGGVGSFADLNTLRTIGKNRLNVTIGSALDLFGGPMSFEKVLAACNQPTP